MKHHDSANQFVYLSCILSDDESISFSLYNDFKHLQHIKLNGRGDGEDRKCTLISYYTEQIILTTGTLVSKKL